MRISKVLPGAIMVVLLVCAGCSEGPEASAAKDIAAKVNQARDLMQEQTAAADAQAEKLLDDALQTPGATIISKQGAQQLLAELVSRSVTQELLGLGERQQSFVQADADLRHSLDELMIQAQRMSFAAGLKGIDDQRLQTSRQEILAKIPPARAAREAAEQARMNLEQSLAATQQAAKTAAVAADKRLLQAEQAQGEEHVIQVAQGAAMRMEADTLLVKARNEELDLFIAKEDETRRAAELAQLESSLERIEQLISKHADMTANVEQADTGAHAEAQSSGQELLAKVEAFAKLGQELSTGYERLIKRQGEAAEHFSQALAGAKARGAEFRKFKSSRPVQAPPDQRVDVLVPLDMEIALATSAAQAKMAQANLEQQLILAFERVRSRAQQIEQVRVALATIGDPEPVVAGSSQTDLQPEQEQSATWPFGLFLSKQLSGVHEAQVEEKPLTAAGVVMNSPQIDTQAIDQRIAEARKAALDDLDSAIKTLWNTAVPRMAKPGTPGDMLEALKSANWRGQVWGMLALAHQTRANLALQMGNGIQAQVDQEAADAYLARTGGPATAPAKP